MSPPTTDAAKTHVLLLTEGRSGSTWLSSFFWFRKEVTVVDMTPCNELFLYL